RHIAKLDIDYSKWEPYETLATIGPRLLHKEFCILSELPEVLVTDENNRPHCADGPSHRWRDGFALYYWHGIRVPRRLIEAPETYTAAEIKAETNSEIHRVFAERLGWDRYLELRGFRVLDTWTDPRTGLCYELLEPETRVGEFEPRYLRMQSPPLHDGSQPYYIEPVSPELRLHRRRANGKFNSARIQMRATTDMVMWSLRTRRQRRCIGLIRKSAIPTLIWNSYRRHERAEDLGLR